MLCSTYMLTHGILGPITYTAQTTGSSASELRSIQMVLFWTLNLCYFYANLEGTSLPPLLLHRVLKHVNMPRLKAAFISNWLCKLGSVWICLVVLFLLVDNA